MTERLSEYFWLHELTRSQLAARHGIDNRVNDAEIITRARGLARNVLDPIREEFGAYSPTSWYRCEKLERLLCERQFGRWRNSRERHNVLRDAGLSPYLETSWETYFATKQHPRGEAADMVLPYCSPEELYRWIARNINHYDQLILEGEPGNSWIHVSYRAKGNRYEMMEMPYP
jgi:hypothetical protein